jgi:hypothetical protein
LLGLSLLLPLESVIFLVVVVGIQPAYDIFAAHILLEGVKLLLVVQFLLEGIVVERLL